jgi:uncharacterized protein (TIGR03083 family)
MITPSWRGAVRPATEADQPAIAAVHSAAFGGDQVPRLVAALSAATHPETVISLVAEDAGRVVGHVLVTPIPLETAPGTTRPVACLSPLAVRPDLQGRGIGSALVAAALAEAARRGEPAVVLEGDPRYYGRFGFVPGSRHGLRRPSERTPEQAFQVWIAPDARAPQGRVLYPDVFWALDAVGLPVDGVTWLDELERQCRWIEGAVAGDVLARPLPACAGWDVGELLRHLGVVERVVTGWLLAGRRPRSMPSRPADGDVRGWFTAGWRRLQEALDAGDAATPAPSWCSWDATLGFWRRRQAHEHVIHALDVAQAVGQPARPVPDAVALDGIDEALRLWLGTRLGGDVGGRGDVVRVTAGLRSWTVGLHEHLVEVHEIEVATDATVSADPTTLYRWLWGRAAEEVLEIEGDRSAVVRLRSAMARATS